MTYEKTNIPGLLKDKKSNVIINRNENELGRVIATRQQKREFDLLKNDVEMLKREVKELKERISKE